MNKLFHMNIIFSNSEKNDLMKKKEIVSNFNVNVSFMHSLVTVT